MASIPLAVNTVGAAQNAFQGAAQNAASPVQLQALINQTKLQQQAEQQNDLNRQISQQTLAQQQVATEQAQLMQQSQEQLMKELANTGGDWNQAIQNLTSSGKVSPQFIQEAQLQRLNVLTKLQSYGSDQLTLLGKQNDAIGEAAIAIKNAPQDQRPTVAAQQLNRLRLSGVQVPDSIQLDDASLDRYIAQSKAASDLFKEGLENQNTAASQPTVQAEQATKQTMNVAQLLANTTGDASYQSVLNNAKAQGVSPDILSNFPAHWSPEAVKMALQASMSPESRAKLPVENLELGSYLQTHPGATPMDFANAKAQMTANAQLGVLRGLTGNQPAAPGTPGGAGGPALTPAQKLGQRVGMTPQAIDQAAQMYLQTGQIPQGGTRGIAGMAQATAIRNRAAELDPNASLMANKGVYQANADSLKNLQKQYDQVTAFENTALKNLDQVAQAASQVPELGSRFGNIPVRMISDKMLGTPQMAQFRTALLTAQTEAAKVLSSATGAGVLSDQARKEAEDVLDGNLPYPAMMASINQLKTDFNNRKTSYQAQIADIQNRLKNAPQSSPAAPQNQQHAPGKQAGLPDGTTGTGSDGKKYIVKGGVWVAQ